MKHLIRLFYVSKSASGLEKSAVADIWEKSSSNNRNLGIAGVLCHQAGYFAQILEGEELPVLNLYVKIARDHRHTDPILISISTTTPQIFNGWAMGVVGEDLVPFADIKDILKLRNSGIEHADAVVMMQRWRKLLESQAGKQRHGARRS